ncbi:MAG: nitroreductase family protein [Sphaerochaetaceae bacterium]
MQTLYPMIFKRKSFHWFLPFEPLSEKTLQSIYTQWDHLIPLIQDIRTAIRIVPISFTSCTRGEYCILIYSERKQGYLQQVGYMGEQLDLWLASQNIGVCWYGVGKPKECTQDGLAFVIMLAIAKQEETAFRKDYRKAKRKPVEQIWEGNFHAALAEIVRFSPSACNTQPWKVFAQAHILRVYRVPGKRGMMPARSVGFYTQIDIGIFLFILELCLKNEGISFQRSVQETFCSDNFGWLTAEYQCP